MILSTKILSSIKSWLLETSVLLPICCTKISHTGQNVRQTIGYALSKIGYYLLPEFTGKSLFISGNLPITGNSKKAVNMNALAMTTEQEKWTLEMPSKKSLSLAANQKLLNYNIMEATVARRRGNIFLHKKQWFIRS